jgi:hypothetical protein
MIQRTLTTRLAALAGTALLLAAPAAAQQPGTSLPDVRLDGLAQTPAESFEDFKGRAVLIEFFAYW